MLARTRGDLTTENRVLVYWLDRKVTINSKFIYAGTSSEYQSSDQYKNSFDDLADFGQTFLPCQW